MLLKVNGLQHSTDETNLANILSELVVRKPYTVAVNLIFVPKHQWEDTTLKEGDVLDVLQPIQGG